MPWDRVKHGFQPGKSGNPGGRPKGYERRFRETVDGETTEHPKLGVIPAWQGIVLKAIEQALGGDRYAREWIGNYLMGKPKESIDVNGDVTPEAKALLAALHLTPHERRQLDAQDTTEDDAAMEALTGGDTE